MVVHASASVPRPGPSAAKAAAVAAALAAAGYRLMITGTVAESALTAASAGRSRRQPRPGGPGRPDQPAMLAAVLAGADVVVAPNTGAAHLAAAVGTPVVSLFAPVVPAARWAPYGVPAIVLGARARRARAAGRAVCPVPGHPCLDLSTPAT